MTVPKPRRGPLMGISLSEGTVEPEFGGRSRRSCKAVHVMAWLGSRERDALHLSGGEPPRWSHIAPCSHPWFSDIEGPKAFPGSRRRREPRARRRKKWTPRRRKVQAAK